MGRELRSGDCQGTCNWGPSGDQIDHMEVFTCSSCDSEWTHDQTWTPRNADGELSPEVAAERAAHPIATSPW